MSSEPASVDRVTRSVLETHYTNVTVVRLDPQPLVEALRAGRTRHRFLIDEVLNEEVIVELNDLRAPNYRLLVLDDDGLHETEAQYVPNTYILRDLTGQEIGRLNIDEQVFEARVRRGEDVYSIRKLSHYVASPETNLIVISRLADASPDRADYCSADAETVAGELLQQGTTTAAAGEGGFEHCVQFEVAGAGDYTLFGIHGMFGTQNRVFEVINMAESILMAEFGLPITVTGNVVSIVPDPYTSTDSQTLLDQFRSHWQDLGVDLKRDLAMLVSGKDFDGGTKGRAAIAQAGDPDEAFAIVQSPETDDLDFMVAHEMFHSLGAHHDESGCAHLLSSLRWTMCPWVGTKGLSGTSRNEIINYVNEHIDLFISEFTLTTNPFYIDGNFTNGELHAGNSIITQDYYLENPAYDVTLLARKKITLKARTRVTSGAHMVCRIVPGLDCSEFDSTSTP